jgi:hypothetical protein
VYNRPAFAAVITTVSLFVAFVLQKACNPYRAATGVIMSDTLGRDVPIPMLSGKTKLKCVPLWRPLCCNS